MSEPVEVLDEDGAPVLANRPAGRVRAGGHGAPTPRPRRVHLASLDDLAKELARLYRQVDSGSLDSGEANRRAWLLSQLRTTLESAQLERRVEALEQAPALGLLGYFNPDPKESANDGQ